MDQNPTRRWPRGVAFAALAAVGAAALGFGFAAATVPDSNGVIHACRDNTYGYTRIIDTASQACTASETAVQWGATGPQGGQGPKGDPGPTGPAGPAGTSAAYMAGGATASPHASLTNNQLKLTVPAGSYAVSAAAVLQNTDTDTQKVDCSINSGGPSDAVMGERDDTGELTIPVFGVFTGPGTITLGCAGFKIFLMDNSQLLAVKVG